MTAAPADRSTFLHSPSPPASAAATPEPPSASAFAPPPSTSNAADDDDDDDARRRKRESVAVFTPVSDLLSSQTHSRPSAAKLRHDLATAGYAVVPGFLAPHALSTLRHAAAHAAAQARAGAWPHVRTLPRQFPPWPADDVSNGIWGVQHLLHPRMPGRDAFVRAYFDAALLDVAAALMRVDRAAGLVLELFNLLVRPDRDFALRWHRDAVPLDGVSRADEARALGVEPGATARDKPPDHVQYNMPLYDDASLILVPGSHLRPRTEAEAAALAADAYADLKGAESVRLRAGDVVFYDNNVLHRGAYAAAVERLTLHGSVGAARGGATRARNVLQHGVGAWVGDADLGALGPEGSTARMAAENMRARLVDLGRRAGVDGLKGIHDE